MATMMAVRFHKYRRSNVLQLEQIELPDPGLEQVLARPRGVSEPGRLEAAPGCPERNAGRAVFLHSR